MKTILTSLILLSFTSLSLAQESAYASSKKFQDHLDEEYADPETSPLTEEELKKFEGLPFFPVDTNFYVKARFVRAKKKKTFTMKTTTTRKPLYDVYGTVYFTINGVEYSLKLYQSHRLREMEEFKENLFLPFKDLTSGEESYGGGRFIDLKIPKGDEIIIDFNTAYNPYCAYNHKYSCPVPPKENFIEVKVLAGVKNPH